MIQQYIKEVEDDAFHTEDFIERLASRTLKPDSSDDYDWALMNDTFLRAVEDLTILNERQHRKCETLQEEVAKEEKVCYQELSLLQDRNSTAFTTFEELDQRINYVVTKVVHVGNRLENINTLRSTAFQAQKLLEHLNEFMKPQPMAFEDLSDKNDLFEAADLIQKLSTISQELPPEKFESACKHIYTKYNEIEKLLIEKFVIAYEEGNVSEMKQLATSLANFRGYSQCVDAFIEQTQSLPVTNNIFTDVLPIVEKNYELSKQIFTNPDQVISKVVLNLYHLKLQEYIHYHLSGASDKKKYLVTLSNLFCKTEELSKKLSNLKIGLEDSFLSKLSRALFQKYLDTYKNDELRYLKNKCDFLFQQFYESKGHQKKVIQSGGLKRELQNVIGNKKEETAGETYLSKKIVSIILDDAAEALGRMQILSNPSILPHHCIELFRLLLSTVFEDFVVYAVDLGLRSIPAPDSKHLPLRRMYFFDTVQQTNEIVHLFENFFSEHMLHLIAPSPKLGECMLLKRNILSSIEMKLQVGLERVVDALVTRSKLFLQSEQRKTDYKPDRDVDIAATPPCLAVVQCLSVNGDHIRESLDGFNYKIFVNELGCRFHSALYDHLQQFQYNYLGAMCAICDVDNYRKCFQRFSSPSVNLLFDTLHAACNLLIVKPENLAQVSSGEQLSVLDRSVILSFICLREDYKTNRLNKEFI